MADIDMRIRTMNDKPILAAKSCVVYVMARDQRLEDNFALQVAQDEALRLEVPLAVVFCLLSRTGHRAREHYQFMLDGLRQLEAALAAKNIPLLMVLGDPRQRLGGILHHLKPQLLVFDFSPLRGPRRLHAVIAAQADCRVMEVDAHNIVPAWRASDHQEFAARTLRPKLQRLLPDYLDESEHVKYHPYDWPGSIQTLDQLQPMIGEILQAIPANGSNVAAFQSGEAAGRRALRTFIEDRLEGYAERRNNPNLEAQSDLSPYLHYGQLSSATIVRRVLQAVGERPGIQADADAFIEEITVRKELSDNFCLYNDQYDSLQGAPEWARKTLEKHADDKREFTYTRQQWERAETHDAAWNAAQRQLTGTGKLHGYMRMYWAKKVLEWSQTPQEAIETLLYLNDFYHLDGGDPNGYVGIMWSVCGVHDRPWGERPVYGTIRSMVYGGLKRKFDIEAYIAQY